MKKLWLLAGLVVASLASENLVVASLDLPDSWKVEKVQKEVGKEMQDNSSLRGFLKTPMKIENEDEIPNTLAFRELQNLHPLDKALVEIQASARKATEAVNKRTLEPLVKSAFWKDWFSRGRLWIWKLNWEIWVEF